MDFGLQTLIWLVVSLGVGAAYAVAGFMVLQGDRSWPGVAMVVGGILQLSGGGLQQVASYLYFNAITMASSPATAASSNELLEVLMQVGSVCAVLGVLTFLAGLLPVCHRHAALGRRTRELEELNRGLQERLEE